MEHWAVRMMEGESRDQSGDFTMEGCECVCCKLFWRSCCSQAASGLINAHKCTDSSAGGNQNSIFPLFRPAITLWKGSYGLNCKETLVKIIKLSFFQTQGHETWPWPSSYKPLLMYFGQSYLLIFFAKQESRPPAEAVYSLFINCTVPRVIIH